MEVVRKAFYRSVPVMAGYVILGIGFGILMNNAGYGVLWSLAMALFIYAGSMQYVGIGLLTGPASIITTIITTIMVNARHLFYSISMVDRYKGAGKYKPYLIFGLTDETYSLLSADDEPGFSAEEHTADSAPQNAAALNQNAAAHAEYAADAAPHNADAADAEPHKVDAAVHNAAALNEDAAAAQSASADDLNRYRFFVTLFDHSYWVSGCVLGSLLGSFIPFSTEGIEFSMTALFIASFTEQWLRSGNHVPALTGLIGTAACLALFGPESFLIPAMLLITAVLTVLRGRLDKKGGAE